MSALGVAEPSAAAAERATPGARRIDFGPGRLSH